MLGFMKLKDYVTLGNAFCGFLSVIFVIRGNLEWASYMILLAVVFDIGDGLVARLTKQFNSFGSELDNIADLISYSVAPAFLVYGYYTTHPIFPHLPWWVAAIVASLPLLAGCVRIARFNVKRIHYPGVWFGFPRPTAAYLYVGYINSAMGQSSELMYWLGIPLIAYSSYAHFILLPFINHHRDKHPAFLKVAYWFIVSSIVFAAIGYAITGINLIWDVVTIWLLNYLLTIRRLTFSPKELKELKQFAADWSADETEV